jgi:hypothetical protein
MSIVKKTLLITISVTLFFTFIFLIESVGDDRVRTNRDLASQYRPMIFSGKPNQMMEISVEPVGGIPEKDEQELTLRATVTLKRPVDQDLEYKWMLPPGVEVVSGHITDGWNNVQAGQVVVAEITVTGLSQESGAVVALFHVETIRHGQKVGNSGVFTPTPENVYVPDSGLMQKIMGASVDKDKEPLKERAKGLNF